MGLFFLFLFYLKYQHLLIALPTNAVSVSERRDNVEPVVCVGSDVRRCRGRSSQVVTCGHVAGRKGRLSRRPRNLSSMSGLGCRVCGAFFSQLLAKLQGALPENVAVAEAKVARTLATHEHKVTG